MLTRYAKYSCLFLVILLFLLNNVAPAATLEKAKDFELNGLDGKTYKLSGMRGKVVLINFWATWCKYCVKEIPSLNRLYNAFKEGGLVVLGISVDRSPLTVETFLQKNSVTYPVLMDLDGKVFVRTYTVIGLPTTFLINKDGYIVEKLIGEQHFDSNRFKQKISALLQKSEG